MRDDNLPLKLTITIKAFERPKSLRRLLKSIQRFYPEMPILVADDSFRKRPPNDVRYLPLPPDVGLSAGRNALVEAVETPYFLLLEDDFQFTADTVLERLLEGVETYDLAVVAGDCVSHRRRGFRLHRWQEKICAKMHFEANHLRLEPGYYEQLGPYYRCDMVTNFFVADTQVIRNVGGWDPELKIQEHEEFFVRLKKNRVPIAYCPEVLINHWHDRSPKYGRYRRRSLRHIGMHKHDFRWFTELSGKTHDFGVKEAA